jgi:nitrite reductase/ring-hydroxylating ferredoxin subunit/uncharacterized membrane protein
MSTTTPSTTEQLTRWGQALRDAIDRNATLDELGRRVSEAVQARVPAGPVKDLLSGTPLGHPVHPMLTDVVIGAWTSAFFLDLVPTAAARRSARFLVGTGLVAALPTVATGLSDVADTTGSGRRLGMAHALTNALATTLYWSSWRRRRTGHGIAGFAYGMAGATVASLGGWLGGHLAYREGVGVDTTVFEEQPRTVMVPAATLPEGEARGFDTDGLRVAVVRRGQQVHAMVARCTHRGGPLDEGRVVGDCLECPWHGSRFALEDGSVVRGPAVAPQATVTVVPTDANGQASAAAAASRPSSPDENDRASEFMQ